MSAYVLALDRARKFRPLLFDKMARRYRRLTRYSRRYFHTRLGRAQPGRNLVLSDGGCQSRHRAGRNRYREDRVDRHQRTSGKRRFSGNARPVTRCTMHRMAVSPHGPQCERLKGSGWIAKSGSAPASCSTRISPGEAGSGCWNDSGIARPGPKRGTGIRYRRFLAGVALSGGRLHVTDASNASAPLLFQCASGEWTEDVAGGDANPPRSLAEGCPIQPGHTERPTPRFSTGRPPIAGIAGDQQAAFSGMAALPGNHEEHVRTGAFLLTNPGPSPSRRRPDCSRRSPGRSMKRRPTPGSEASSPQGQ